MLFSSSVFLFLFLPAVLFCYYVPFRGLRHWQNALLLFASLLFYAFGEPWFVLVLMISIVANWAFGLWAGRARKAGRSVKPAVVCTAMFNLGILFVFKYLAFTLTNLNLLGLSLWVPAIGLPAGISFFTFKAVSYVADVARGDVRPQPSLFKVGLYIALFPQLLAGPITRYGDIADEIDRRRETWADFAAGVERLLMGLGKKVLLSNQLAVVADMAFRKGGPSSAAFAWLGAVCYALQLYFDFAGYSDMAIGMGRMFGFHFPENFNYPCIAVSVTDFWRRWHISLSSWFRDYVYIPLGGGRGSKWKTARNLLVVWLLTGIWHGANWTFVVWGLLYCALLMLERFAGLSRGWPKPLGRLYAFLSFVLVFTVFRAASLGEAATYYRALAGIGVPALSGDFFLYLREYAPILVPAFVCAAPTATWARKKLSGLRGGRLLPLWDGLSSLCLLAVFILSVAFIVKGTYNPFIYFNF